MADYCTVTDIEVLLGFEEGLFSVTSRPTLTAVQREIDQVTQEIDFVLASVGITTQPTDTRVLGRLRNCCQFGVAWKIGYSSFGNNTGVDDSQPDTYRQQYQDCLQDIRDNPNLYGAVTGDEAIYISNQVTDGTTTEDAQVSEYVTKDYEV